MYSTSKEYNKKPENSVYFPIWNSIIKMVKQKECIVEIGCGSGQLANLLIRNRKNYKWGFDYSHVAVDKAKERNPEHTTCFDVTDIYTRKKLPNVCTVICTEVLEHLDNDMHVIDILEPGTRFIFSVPNFWSKTHKRVFKNIDEIANRYKSLTFKHTQTFCIGPTSKIFLIDSIKN